jgi:DNA-binding NarL/FixJ family response regulator
VLVVDDHRVVAETFRMAIDVEDDVECVGLAGSAEEALALVSELSPDVVVMDVRLPGVDGIEASRQIKALHPSVRVLIVSAYTGVDVVARAAAAGASGVLSKEGALADMVKALKTAGGSRMIVDSLALDAPAPQDPARVTGPARNLTEREVEILALMSEGLNPKSIAVSTGISLQTARGHVKSIMAKLDAHSQLEAVVIAAREGLVSL